MDNPGDTGLCRCAGCGVIFRPPEPADGYPRDIPPVSSRSSLPDRYTERKFLLHRDLAGKIAPYRKCNRVLDVGAGEGHFLRILGDRGWEIHGVELAPELVEKTRQVHGIHVFHGTLEKAGFPGEYFDVVSLINVIEHMDRPLETFREAFRLLRKGGVLVLRTPNALVHASVMRMFYSLRAISGSFEAWNPAVLHRFAFDRKSMKAALSRVDFQEIRICNGKLYWSSSRSAAGWPWRMAQRFVEFLFDRVGRLSGGRILLSPSLVVVAEKQ
jgi:SAM-dependent methyltransferase